MHMRRHTHASTRVQSAHNRSGDNQAQEPGWEGRKKGFVKDLAHTQKKQCQEKPIFTDLKKIFENIDLPAKLLDILLRGNKSNINRLRVCVLTLQCLRQPWVAPVASAMGTMVGTHTRRSTHASQYSCVIWFCFLCLDLYFLVIFN